MKATLEDKRKTIAYAKFLLNEEISTEGIGNRIELGIAEIKTLVGEMLDSDLDNRLSPILASALKTMVQKGIDPDLASDVVHSIVVDTSTTHQESRELISQELLKRIPQSVPPPSRVAQMSTVIALVGPTGVGKTTTIAKLATKFHLQQGRSVALITADMYRVAAVEQLQRYADLFDSMLAIAGTAEQMKEAIASCASADIVLIDTAGRSALDGDRIDETSNILKVARPDEIHLVLSAATSRTATKKAVEGFAVTGYDRVIISKLDEATQFGEMVSTLCSLHKPLSWFTNGQDISTHIDLARPSKLVDSIWDEEHPITY